MPSEASFPFSSNLLADIIAFLFSTPQSQYSAVDANVQTALPSITKIGYWGPVDWCEPNYAVTPYIAEFWNTISAIPMFTWSLVGWYLSYTAGVKETRFRVLLASLGFIGLGSACFHGTLRFSAQLLDELPMMMASYCSLFCALEIKNHRPRNHVVLACVLGALFHAISYAVFKWYFIFIAGYSLVMLVQIIIITRHIAHDFKYNRWRSQSFWVAITGLTMILGSCALWILENAFCEQLGKFKLHAIWHCFGGYGLFLLDLLLIMLRGEYLKKASNVRFSKEVACHFVEWIDV